MGLGKWLGLGLGLGLGLVPAHDLRQLLLLPRLLVGQPRLGLGLGLGLGVRG